MSASQMNQLVPDATSDEQVTAFFRRHLPDFYFINTSLSRMRRHLALLERVPFQPFQLEFSSSTGAGFTELCLCALDENRPGLLAKIAGVLTTLKINVHTAWIHTLHDPHDEHSRRAIALDTLILSEPYFGRTRVLTSKTSRSLAQALEDALNNRSDFSARTSRRVAAPLRIHELEARVEGEFLMIKLVAADASGVLFRLAHALAELELTVAHAQINTFERAVDDVFFVTRASGIPIDSSEAPALLSQLRAVLEREFGT